ncbi:MAG: hypothetical protein ACOYO1_11310 [Bacteroidales bacterium]
MYSKEFKELVEKGEEEKFYIGLGNPNAKILFVGQEAAIGSNDDENKAFYLKNVRYWKENIHNNSLKENELNFIPSKDNPSQKALRMTGHTWRKYQILHNYSIIDKDNKSLDGNEKFRIDFLENVFTTEMSDAPAKRKQNAQQKKDLKSKLDLRRNTFFKSEFIQQFPVVILACWDYIKNDDNDRQIDDVFNVKFCEKESSNDLDFWVHYNEKRSKLVIHTHQLSGSVAPDDLLKPIGNIIRKFMFDNGYI